MPATADDRADYFRSPPTLPQRHFAANGVIEPNRREE
jgi:hypothetical protein